MTTAQRQAHRKLLDDARLMMHNAAIGASPQIVSPNAWLRAARVFVNVATRIRKGAS